MQSKPSILISLVNWHSGAQTVACIEQIAALDYDGPYEVVVVDNHSQDDSVATIREACPDVTLMVLDENRGYAGGHAVAVRYAQERGMDAIWLLNSDVELRADTLGALVEAWQAHGPALYGSVPLKMNEPERIGGFIAWEVGVGGRPDFDRPLAIVTADYATAFGGGRDVYPAAGLAGVSMMVPLDVIARHGFMDERFFLYSEEVDYCLRLLKAGVKGYIVAGSVLYHDYGGSYRGRGEIDTIIHYYYERNRLILMRRHMGLGRFLRQLGDRFGKALRGTVKYVVRHENAPTALEMRCLNLIVWDGAWGIMKKRFDPVDYRGR